MASPLLDAAKAAESPLRQFIGGVTQPIARAANGVAPLVNSVVNGAKAAAPTVSPEVANATGKVLGNLASFDAAGRAGSALVNNVFGPGDDAVEKIQGELNKGTWRENVPNWIDQAGRGAAIGAHKLATLASGGTVDNEIYSLGEPPAPAATTVAPTTPAAPPKVIPPSGGETYPMSVPSNTPIGVGATPPAVPAGETGVRAFKMDNGQKMFTNVDGNAAAVAGLSAANAPAGAAVANSMPAPKVAPAAPSVAMNPALVNMQQQLMSQFQNAQDVVAQGSNRDGYKMGDVTKAGMLMQNLNTAMSSINNLTGQTYGVDAGMVNHAADNTARVGIANAGNQTELLKADVAGQYALRGHKLTADGALNLATHKAGLEKTTPDGILALAKAEEVRQLTADKKPLSAAQRLALLHPDPITYDKDPITGLTRGRNVGGVYQGVSDAELLDQQRVAATAAALAKANKK